MRLRFKIILGFAVTLAISAASMGIAYLGFERVAAGVASYRHSVSEADLARNIDRELISYRSLARYFVVTGKEEDGKAALAAEASLKDAIDQSMKGTTNPARREQVAQLGKEFQNFSQDFRRHSQAQGRERAGDAKSADAQRQYAALQARRSSPATPTIRNCKSIQFGAKHSNSINSGGDGARQHLRHQFRP